MQAQKEEICIMIRKETRTYDRFSSQNELSCSEVGREDRGDQRTKEVKELGLKVPKMMKDQLYSLQKHLPEESRDLVTIGFVMMGKYSEFFNQSPLEVVDRYNS